VKQQKLDEGMQDAHVWWSYVWHEMRRQAPFTPSTGGAEGFSAISLADNNGVAGAISKKLGENLRSQAIELATVRQVRRVRSLLIS
jgi:hypothetical protein